jgi:GT2 family glycosyltransferase
MRQRLTDSFDHYSRYRYVIELREAAFGSEPIRLLDVGDPFGHVGELFPGDDTVSVDLFTEGPGPPGHRRVIGSGLELPFPDGSFDLVVSHDTYEHIPDDLRRGFVAELLRVGRGPVLVVAPFADPRTELCERLVGGYFVARTGRPLPPLEEHRACGLPSLAGLLEHTGGLGVEADVYGDLWLDQWLGLWLVRCHLLGDRSTEPLIPLLDAAVNGADDGERRRGPHYRRVVLLRPGGAAGFDLPRPQEPADPAADLARLQELYLQMVEVLRGRDDPLDGRSALRGWADRARTGDGPLAPVAGSLANSLQEAARSREGPGPVPRPEPRPEPPAPRPTRSVTVVLVNLNGADHLGPCLDSLAEQDYPKDLFEVVVVDNGSTDGSRELLASRYPWVKVLAQDTNLGFAPAVNLGAAAVSSDCVALLNNDMRAAPDWLSRLVEAYEPHNGVVCVGGQILSWDGSRLDFGDSSMNFYGMGQQLGFGRPVERVEVRDGQELLFACGGSMLVGRQLFLDTGGFDPGFFAYFEDVDFGWRLWVLGFKVRLATRARTYHRHHGTSSRFPDHQRVLLYERNALRAVIKNYDDEHLHRVLGPALLLAAKRAGVRSQLDRAAYHIGGDRGLTEEVPRVAMAHLHAIIDVVDDLDGLMRQRTLIQRARRRDDTEIVARFGRPLQPVLADAEFVAAHERVVSGFGLDRVFERRRATRVLVISNDALADKMSGPAIRAWEIAKALAKNVEVLVAVPEPTTKTAEGVTVASYAGADALHDLACTADVVLVQGYTLRRHPFLGQLPALLVADLYDPWLFENLQLRRDHPAADRELADDASVINELLDHADFFICASERQRDYWLGMLAGRGRLQSGLYERDPSLRTLIDVVPFGLPERRPRADAPVLKGVHPRIGADDPVVLWGGGTWSWFDPLSLIEAFARVLEEVPEAKLYFLGTQLASPNVARMPMAEAVVRRAEELGLAGSSVLFGDWVPYDEREAYLLEADVAVSAAADLAETRLAFRSRVLDYLWAGLPVVATAGDVLSDLVERERLGLVVPPGDVEGLAAALRTLLTDPVLRAGCAERAQAAAERFTWTRAVEPLRRLTAEPWRWRTARDLRYRGRDLTEDVQAVLDHQQGRIHDLEPQALRLQELEGRLARLRRTPVWPAYRAARWLRRRVRPTG